MEEDQGGSAPAQAPIPNYDPNQDVIGMGLWMQNTGKPIAPNPAQPYTDPTAAIGSVPSYIPFGTEDGQKFEQQSPWTQETFKAQYGDQAEAQWSQQHNQEIKGTRATYGANTKVGTYNPTPANIPVRQYAPLASGSIVPGQNITPQGSVPYVPPRAAIGAATAPMPGTKTPIKNPDGSYTTERSITVTDPRLNGGRPTNIPSVWNGVVVSDDQAVQNAAVSGRSWPAYGSIPEAETAARARSDALGKGLVSIGGAVVPGTTSTLGPNGQPIKDTDYVTLQDTRSGETLQLTESDWKAQQRDFPWITEVLRVVAVSPVKSMLLPAAPVSTVSQINKPVVPQPVSTIKPPMVPGTVVGQAGAGLPTTKVVPGQIPTTFGPVAPAMPGQGSDISTPPTPSYVAPAGATPTPIPNGPPLGTPQIAPTPLPNDVPEAQADGTYTFERTDGSGGRTQMSIGEYNNLGANAKAIWKLIPHPNARVNQSDQTGQFGDGTGLKPKPDVMHGTYDPVTGQEVEQSYTSTQQAQVVPTVSAEARPVETLAQMSVQRQGGSVADTRTESTRILNGIGGLMRGDKASAWAEPYLNDVARMAWAKENRDSGTNVDPRQAPLDYIEKWKDAFYGSDPSVPFVKDLDQQMMDNAVDYSHGNQAFDWKQAFGPNGESGLISRQIASNDCGTNTFASLLRSRGYNLDPATALAYGQRMGYHDGEQFRGPQAMVTMLHNEAGLDAQARPVDWRAIDAELDAGRPVGLSSGGHWWTVASYRDTPQGRQYYTGATGAVVGNPQWARPDEIQYGGAPNTMVTVHGDVDPNARGITALNLRPPGSQGTRANLSVQTNAAMNPQRTQQAQVGRANMSYADDQAAVAAYDPQIIKYSQQNGVDPDLTRAVMGQESQGSAGATSGVGAKGLMQLMPDTARGLGVTDITDPDQNIDGGSKYLAQLLQQFDGNLDMALAAYNAGPGNVMRYGGIPPFQETQDYVQQVKARYAALKQAQASQNSQYGTTR